MPRRPIRHELADQGVAEVARILTSAGWACDDVKSDYGEDLICQTSYNGAVDPHRILIQVKSTQKKVVDQGFELAIKKATLLKWLSDSNLVVLCLWSLSDRAAFFQVLGDQFGVYDIDLSRAATFRVKFSKDNVLNKDAVNLLAWRARLRNINRHFLENKNYLETLDRGLFDTDDEYHRAKNQIQRNLFSIATKFLIYINLVEEVGDKIVVDTRSFLYELMHLGSVAANKDELKKLSLECNAIILLVILMRAARTVPKVGFPVALLEEAVRYYSTCLFEKINLALPNKYSKKAFENQVVSIAKKVWKFGSKFSAQEIKTLIEKDDFFAESKRAMES